MGLSIHRRQSTPPNEMSMIEHLRELRKRLIISIIAVSLGAVVGLHRVSVGPHFF